MEQAYHRVHELLSWSAGHQQQKDIVFMVNPNKKATQFGYWILLWQRVSQRNFTTLGKDPSASWRGYLNAIYLVESSAGKPTQTIVHFNRLKLCKAGTRFQHNDDSELWPNADSPIGGIFISHWREPGMVDIDDVPMAQPGRVRQPPSHFADFVSHWLLQYRVYILFEEGSYVVLNISSYAHVCIACI